MVVNMGFFDKARGKLNTPFQEGASLSAQSAWRVLPSWKKNQLRRTLKDTDHDGVPDKFDCQPFNPKKQDAETLSERFSSRMQYSAQPSSPDLSRESRAELYDDNRRRGRLLK
jgi:hypothetical protein